MVHSPLEYTVSMARANTHCFDVTLRVHLGQARGGPMRLMMPVWTPGHYVIEDFPRNVYEVKAQKRSEGDEWREASVEKESKNIWKVDWTGTTDTILVSYSVYAFEYHNTKSYLDQVHAIINGASVFIYPVGMEADHVDLQLVPYNGWDKVSTGLEQQSKWEFSASSIDELIDSPVEVGNQDVRSFWVQNVEHQISLFGDAPLDKEGFVDDIRKIVQSEISVFEQVPYKKYVFLVNFTDEAVGGLEHLNSTVCFIPRLRLVPREEYNLIMGLVSHEFFHTWNVKRLRPKGLGPFNYSTETYTRSLWIAEGITSYYDDYVLRRTGLYTVAEYLEAFAINVNQMKSLPGRKWQSAQEASFDTWIKYYKTDANAPNAIMSYYTQGAVIGWMLDLQIRKNTKGQRNLDEVMRKIYEVTYCKEGRGYSEDEFRATTMEIGGKAGLGEIFDSRVAGREDVDFDRYLDYVGLRLEPKEGLEGVRGFLGIRLNAEGGKATVKARLADSPAEAMGLSENDEIIGVDGFRLSPDKFSFYIANRRPGATVRIAIARNGVLMELAGGLVQKPAFEYKIAPLSETTEEQRLLFRNWLLEDWKPQIKYPEYLRSPDRKPILDYF